MRRLLSTASVIAAILLLAAPARGQTTEDIADQAIATGYYVDSGIGAADFAGDIDAEVVRAGNAGVRFVVVLLDANPSGGAVTFGDFVLDRMPGGGTVLVLSASQEAIVSDVFDTDTRERALDRGFDAAQDASGPSGAGDAAFVGAVVDVLTGSGSGGSSGSGGGVWVLIFVVGALVVGVFFLVRSSSKARERSTARRVAEAKAEIQSQLDAMANTILEITDQVRLSEPETDNEYLEDAGATYTEASEQFGRAEGLRDLEAISDRLDEARWQLDAAAAIAAGDPVPERPAPEERASCFFDPTHSGPFEDAEVTTSAGSKTVRVCRKDAETLRRGEEAKPRMIEVGGRRVPAAGAPRSHGGAGFDLGDVLSVIVGGMGAGRSLGWGGGGRRRRRTSGTGSRRSRGSSGSRSRSRGRTGRSRRRRR